MNRPDTCSGPWPGHTARLPAITTATRAAAIAITAASSTVSVSAAGTTVTAARSAITAITAITATACTATIATTSSTAITTRAGRVRGIGRRLHARGAGPAVALRTARIVRVRRWVGHRWLIRLAERRAGAAQVAGVCRTVLAVALERVVAEPLSCGAWSAITGCWPRTIRLIGAATQTAGRRRTRNRVLPINHDNRIVRTTK